MFVTINIAKENLNRTDMKIIYGMAASSISPLSDEFSNNVKYDFSNII